MIVLSSEPGTEERIQPRGELVCDLLGGRNTRDLTRRESNG